MESRLDSLEVRYTHLERQVDELSHVVFSQQKVIDRLALELSILRNRAAGVDGPNERPPHY
jgi:uncharacterized coiled-coil protein SlyX